MKRFIFLLFLLITFTSYAQKFDNIWLSGYSSNTIDSTFGGTTFNFEFTPPSVSYEFREMSFSEVSASICDKDGNLLFYTNGTWVANANHEEMINGDNIGLDAYHQSWADDGLPFSQSALILPYPNNESLFFLIHEEVSLGGASGSSIDVSKCYYTLIDMNEDNGLGGVVYKNESIINDTLDVGKVTATKHANGRDWWVLVPNYTSTKYHTLFVSPQGVNWEMEQIVEDTSFSGVGQAIFSPDGSKYIRSNACCFNEQGYVDIFDFDRCTGLLSNPQRIVVDTIDGLIDLMGGVVVSPNSRFLYFMNYDKIIQYDLQASDILSTADTVAIYDGFVHSGGFPAPTHFRLAHLAPNGKIYINTPANSRYLHIIHEPNEQGVACNVEQHGLELPTWSNRTMPNFPNFRLYAEIGSPCDTLRPIAQFLATPNELDITFTDESQRTPIEWFWTFGDGDSSVVQHPQHTYLQQGTYEVCLIVSNEAGSDTTCQMVDIILDNVEDLNLAPQIKLSPNPTDGNVLLQLPKDRNEDWEIEWYDNYGRILLIKDLSQSMEQVNISLYHLPSGVYFYKITNELQIIKVGKLVKE